MHENVICKLEQILKENNRVILLPSRRSDVERVLVLLNSYSDFLEDKKVLLITDLQEVENRSDRLCQITEEEMERISKLYNTYEFSNRVLLCQTINEYCGSLMNYVKNGLLTEDECICALLGD